MLKFRLIAGDPRRLAGLIDDAEYDIDTSRMDEMQIAEFRAILDDSPTDEMEVIPGIKDD